jgi:hypothetical protein
MSSQIGPRPDQGCRATETFVRSFGHTTIYYVVACLVVAALALAMTVAVGGPVFAAPQETRS